MENTGNNGTGIFRKKNKETGELATHHGIKPLQAPIIYGVFPILYSISYNGKTYTIFDSPHDGSCCYYSLSAVMHPSNSTKEGTSNLLF